MTKIKKFKTENYVERLFCECGAELIYQFDFWGILDACQKKVYNISIYALIAEKKY